MTDSARPSDSPEPETGPPRFGRRGFFRRLLSRGLDDAERLGQAAARRLSGDEHPPRAAGPPQPAGAGLANERPPSPVPLRMLRPPGALPEAQFTDVCARCGDCARACPAECIVIDPTIDEGRPHIVARHAPCLLCEDLACMKACPSGALQLVDAPEHIAMGVAEVDAAQCVRSAGEDCRICVQQCPFGESAIAIDDHGQVEVLDGCVGCGICECACPTEPEAIYVTPATHRGAE